MKNLIIIVTIVLSSSLIFAQKTADDYVTNEEGTIFYTNLKYGIFNFLKGEVKGGENISYKKDEVIEYKKDGQIYTKLPEIVDNKVTNNYVFMELLSYKSGLKLYRYSKLDANGKEIAEIYIFNEDEFVVDLNINNYQHLTVFFTESLINTTSNLAK